MKTFIIGSKSLSVGILNVLIQQGHEVLGVFSRDGEEGMKIWHNELGHASLKEEAMKLGIPVYEKVSVNSTEARELLESLNLDVIFSCFWSEIFKEETLSIPRIGVYNFHTAYLPNNRGSRPIPWSIIKGESFTGMTIHKMLPGVDNGPIAFQTKVKIEDDDTAKTLYEKVCSSGLKLFKTSIEHFAREDFDLIDQEDRLASYQARGEPFGGQISYYWDETAKNRLRRAFTFPPFRSYRNPPQPAYKSKPTVYFLEVDIPEITLPEVDQPWKRNNIGSKEERTELRRLFSGQVQNGVRLNQSIAGMHPVSDVLILLKCPFVISKISNCTKWSESFEAHQPHPHENGLLEIPAVRFQSFDELKITQQTALTMLKRHNRDIFVCWTADTIRERVCQQIQILGLETLTFSEVYTHFNTEYENIGT